MRREEVDFDLLMLEGLKIAHRLYLHGVSNPALGTLVPQ